MLIPSMMALRARREDENRSSSGIACTIRRFSEELAFKWTISNRRRGKQAATARGRFKQSFIYKNIKHVCILLRSTLNTGYRNGLLGDPATIAKAQFLKAATRTA